MNWTFTESVVGWDLASSRARVEILARIAHEVASTRFAEQTGYTVTPIRLDYDQGEHISYTFQLTGGRTPGYTLVFCLQRTYILAVLRDRASALVHGAGCLLGLVSAGLATWLFPELTLAGGGLLVFALLWLGAYLAIVFLAKLARIRTRAIARAEREYLVELLQTEFRHAGTLSHWSSG